MSFLQPGRSRRDAESGSHHRSILRRQEFKRVIPFYLPFFFATALLAQEQQTAPNAVQNSNTWDCSDPLLSSTPQCTGQTPEETNQGVSSQMRVPGAGAYPGFPGQPQILTRSYSDIESQTQRNANRNQFQQQFPLLPEPLTEFQKFTASTSGQILPIFGANLFQNVPSTFAPLDMAPVPPNYIIGPGDVLRLKVWGQVNFQANVTVDRAGEVYVPISQVGPVHVAGIPTTELDQHLREAIGRVYRNFDLQVDVGQIRAMQIYVAGEARRPGVYTVSSLSSLVDALFASGGPSVQGSLRHIQVRRGSQTVTDFDLYAFLIRGDKSTDVKLASGDVIFIPPVGAQAAVTGSVRNPAIYELRANESLADLIADAGGLSTVASEARVSIERIEDHNARHAMEVAYDQPGLATQVAEGDLIRVFSILPQYQKTVTLRGNIANPGRFAWHPGMHVSELIPDKESLITRNYWWKRAQLGLPAPEFEPIPGFSEMRQPNDNHPITLPPPSTQPRRGVNNGTDNTSPTQEQNGMPADQYQYDQNGTQDQLGIQQGQYQELNSQQPLTAQQRGSSTSLAGQQASISSRVGRSTKIDISQNAPEVDWDYAVIQRLDPNNLKTVLVAFDLGKLVLQHDASQDIELQPGDVVTILSEADIRIPIAQQTKLVKLEGEFAHSGLYSVQPGETLRQLVQRTGGLTPNAYLYGSEFTRESTRVVQQARIDEYVQSLDMRIQRGNLALAASPVSSAQDLASGSAAQNSERELITRLRQIRATGRIVLQFKPGSSGIGTLPDVTLEDGDHFVIPPVPASINVVGSVNNQNSFLYSPDRRVRSYLQMAGGVNRDADRKRAFVIRADGEVVAYDSTKGLWGNDFLNLRMFPGDTIVVPEKTFRPTALRGLLDWSQLFSQFALGAASISVIQ
jgi:protein involved in polysaccharide export with SLBB domain